MPPIGTIVFVIGIVVGFLPMWGYHSWQNDKREKEIADAKLLQEKENVRIVTQYQDLLSGVSDWYGRNPVRVRIQGCQGSAGAPAPTADGITVTVGGIQRSYIETVDK